MDYTVRYSKEMFGYAVPLSRVAESMARHRASSFGKRPHHRGTYLTVKGHFDHLLIQAVSTGGLEACDQYGAKGTIDEIVSADLMAIQNPDLPKIYSLYAKESALNRWGIANEYTFTFEDTGVRDVKSKKGLAQVEGTLPSDLKFKIEQVPVENTQQATLAAVVTSIDGNPLPTAIHSTKTRRHVLTPVIEQAQRQCSDPNDTAAVWAVLMVMADKKTAPLIGATEDGLQYLKNGTVASLNREALRKRLRR